MKNLIPRFFPYLFPRLRNDKLFRLAIPTSTVNMYRLQVAFERLIDFANHMGWPDSMSMLLSQKP